MNTQDAVTYTLAALTLVAGVLVALLADTEQLQALGGLASLLGPLAASGLAAVKRSAVTIQRDTAAQVQAQLDAFELRTGVDIPDEIEARIVAAAEKAAREGAAAAMARIQASLAETPEPPGVVRVPGEGA